MQKSINYGNSNYAIITADNEDIDMPIPQTALKLPLPVITDDFFSTLDSVITFSKQGYLKMIFKANLVTVTGGVVDLQICVNGLPSPNQRHRFKSDTYIEVSFESEIVAGDTIEIRYAGSVAGMVFEYLPITSDFLRQPPYVISLELVNSLVATDEATIGNIIHHASPNLHNTNKRYIPIDVVGGLILNKEDYPLFYGMFTGTYIIDDTYVDTLTFKVADNSAYPYLRGITTDQPTISWQEQATDMPSHNHTIPGHDHSLSLVKTKNEGSLGEFGIGTENANSGTAGMTHISNYNGNFEPGASFSGEGVQGDGSSYSGTKVRLNDRQRTLEGSTDATSLTTDSKSISTTNEVKSVSFFRYIIADNQD